MSVLEDDAFFRRLHLLWFGREASGRISLDLKLRLLVLLNLVTQEEEAQLQREFAQVLNGEELARIAQDSAITLARLREIEARALEKLEHPADDEDR